jgi:hypothetical protein
MASRNLHKGPGEHALGFRGGLIEQHRSLRSLEFPASRWFEIAGLLVGFELLIAFGIGAITEMWRVFLEFWLQRVGINAPLIMEPTPLWFGLTAEIPSISLFAAAPSEGLWTVHLLLVVALSVGSFLISDRLMPIRFLMRFVALVHASSVAYFGLAPNLFIHDPATYLRDSFVAALALLTLVPPLLALTYYIFPFSSFRKIGLTLLTLGYLIIWSPTRLLVHAVCMQSLSAIMIPILYLVFGVFLDILVLMALYSWAMSWRRTSGNGESAIWRGK